MFALRLTAIFGSERPATAKWRELPTKACKRESLAMFGHRKLSQAARLFLSQRRDALPYIKAAPIAFEKSHPGRQLHQLHPARVIRPRFKHAESAVGHFDD